MKISLGGKLGTGNFADVWDATDELERAVAVKIVREAGVGVSDALDHAKALVKAAHPNVVKVHSIEEIKDPTSDRLVKAVVMERIQGQTLDDRIKGPIFTSAEAETIGLGMLDGMLHMHQVGLVHGDFHGENVMLADECHVKILDILYRDSLAKLTTASRERRITWDKTQMRMLLQDVLSHSSVGSARAKSFGSTLAVGSDLKDVRKAFLDVFTAPSNVDVDYYYRRFDDEDFVEGTEYAQALSEDTPDDVIVPLLMKSIDMRGMARRRKRYVGFLWKRIGQAERKKLLAHLSEALDSETPKGNWAPLFRLLSAFGSANWQEIKAVTRIRFEKAVANDILKGRVDVHSSSKLMGGDNGALGTWANGFGPYFSNTEDVVEAIVSMLRGGWYTQNYIGRYLLTVTPALATSPSRREALLDAIRSAIRNDARIVKSRIDDLPEDWQEAIQNGRATDEE